MLDIDSNNSHDKMKINLGHRVGPFIIIDKVDDKYIGIYGTTKNVYNKDHEILEVNTIFRKTYFVLDFIRNISRENIGGKIETLDESPVTAENIIGSAAITTKNNAPKTVSLDNTLEI